MGFAEDDKAKIVQLWKNGHQSLAVAFLILKVLLLGRHRIGRHRTEDTRYDRWVTAEEDAGRTVWCRYFRLGRTCLRLLRLCYY